MIANNAFGRAKTFARFACALRALIVAGASCNNHAQVSHSIASLFLSLTRSLRLLEISHVKRKLHTLTRCSVEWTAVVTGDTSIAMWSISQVSTRLNADAAVWKTLTMPVALTGCKDLKKNCINDTMLDYKYTKNDQ